MIALAVSLAAGRFCRSASGIAILFNFLILLKPIRIFRLKTTISRTPQTTHPYNPISIAHCWAVCVTHFTYYMHPKRAKRLRTRSALSFSLPNHPKTQPFIIVRTRSETRKGGNLERHINKKNGLATLIVAIIYELVSANHSKRFTLIIYKNLVVSSKVIRSHPHAMWMFSISLSG